MIEIYGKNGCVYCNRAVALCESKGYEFRYYNLDKGEWDIEIMTERLGSRPRSVPIIFVNLKHIGGYTELERILSH